MNLTKVTITGADDSIKVTDLLPINERFPFVEWGILVSKRTEGQAAPRFPSANWLVDLVGWYKVARVPLNLSLHICGRWVRDICRGEWTIFEDLLFGGIFQRIQLNFHSYVHNIKKDAFIKGLQFREKLLMPLRQQIIFQLDDVNNGLLDIAREADIDAVPLFDLSGGAGILPEEWPIARLPFSGYAGGLSPDNLENQLEIISNQAGEVPIWIDVESGIRSEGNGQFDLEKVVRFLEIAERWIK
jgi:phosphoribosylanthranilate isomerase